MTPASPFLGMKPVGEREKPTLDSVEATGQTV